MRDKDRANHALEFISRLKQVKGKWAGQTINLTEWEKKFIEDIFGTVNEDGYRRYRTAFIFIPRKNGKSTFAAAVALYLLFADGEAGGEIYGAAFDRDQASLVFDIAAQMARASGLSKYLDIIDSRKRIIDNATGSFYRAIPADAAGAFGFSASGIIFDEFHTQKTRELYDALITSTGARREPLTLIITTAGYNRESICYELYDYAKKVQDGVINDSTFYPMIFEAPEGADWTDEEVWKIANPSLDITIPKDYIRQECEKALQNPRYQNTFKRLHLNIWTTQETRWIDPALWDSCGQLLNEKELEAKPCYVGLDLSATTDFTAIALLFPRGGAYDVLCRFYCPAEKINERARKEGVPLEYWIREGYIKVTPGNVVDYEFIKRDILELARQFKIREIAFDPWNATQFALELEREGFVMVEHRQGYKSMSPPAKELERLILSGKINHGGNPVLRWQADNVMIVEDAAGNIKPDKSKSMSRIDGIVALIMALGSAMRHEPHKKSVYEERGFMTL